VVLLDVCYENALYKFTFDIVLDRNVLSHNTFQLYFVTEQTYDPKMK